MTTTRTLPHDPYIDAVVTEFTNTAMTPEQYDVRDSESCGMHLMLDAVITLTPEDSGIPSDRYPHGLILLWEYHDGHEDGCLNEGAVWQWARLNEDGSNWLPEPLPVPGWVMPAMLAGAVVTLAHTGTATPMTTGWHQHLRTPVQDAIEAWASS
ncbi:hypothetical protein [Streptomyces fungicidicus]|uniref:hypothetical protein n=1 Tax=Streptomyces fungicidicus TaxID=68203 RepID=UPI00382EFEE5